MHTPCYLSLVFAPFPFNYRTQDNFLLDHEKLNVRCFCPFECRCSNAGQVDRNLSPSTGGTSTPDKKLLVRSGAKRFKYRQSPRPAFYSQPRVDKKNRPFPRQHVKQSSNKNLDDDIKRESFSDKQANGAENNRETNCANNIFQQIQMLVMWLLSLCFDCNRSEQPQTATKVVRWRKNVEGKVETEVKLSSSPSGHSSTALCSCTKFFSRAGDDQDNGAVYCWPKSSKRDSGATKACDETLTEVVTEQPRCNAKSSGRSAPKLNLNTPPCPSQSGIPTHSQSCPSMMVILCSSSFRETFSNHGPFCSAFELRQVIRLKRNAPTLVWVPPVRMYQNTELQSPVGLWMYRGSIRNRRRQSTAMSIRTQEHDGEYSIVSCPSAPLATRAPSPENDRSAWPDPNEKRPQSRNAHCSGLKAKYPLPVSPPPRHRRLLESRSTILIGEAEKTIDLTKSPSSLF